MFRLLKALTRWRLILIGEATIEQRIATVSLRLGEPNYLEHLSESFSKQSTDVRQGGFSNPDTLNP